MKIERVEQYHIRMKLKHPFETSFGRMEVYDKILLAVYAGGEVGWGESPVDDNPFYLDETIDTAWVIQQQFLIPMLLRATFNHATDLPGVFPAYSPRCAGTTWRRPGWNPPSGTSKRNGPGAPCGTCSAGCATVSRSV